MQANQENLKKADWLDSPFINGNVRFRATSTRRSEAGRVAQRTDVVIVAPAWRCVPEITNLCLLGAAIF